ncbi:polysaccharide biosynthesis/export family protein [Pelagicoccus sp. SDUM812002]|uniref:polysaccharide biosynthesis/export family protein n=1 Tax=Pelagicoccus sp. SDUM812002 TaxID=3041266 RepID=UPI00280E08A4|nr:polysaccharide biosynthesis/export family protein [Pelagicoccus sp. SDUM812002]MDQ8187878.1 polysaccharide biosynthesis/export family protein [Pelagicoccus sp. SDUM812002]
MKNKSFSATNSLGSGSNVFLRLFLLLVACFLPLVGLSAQVSNEKFILQAEDMLRISFPGAPELDTQLQIRRDGVISAPIIGEVLAAGKTPSELESELSKKFENQLVSNEVMVVVLESHFTYYLEGEVRNPGIIESFRQLSVLEAIIAAGGIDKTTGKMKSVVVIRRKGEKYQHFELDLAAVIDGKKDGAFVLESYDIVSVPQRVW